MKCAVLTWFMLVLAMGCSSEKKKSDAHPPTGFTANDPTKQKGATVLLRGHTSDGGNGNVAVDVVARGIDRGVHGAAFRLHWDPAQLGFNVARGSRAWSSQALLLTKEGAPGELVVAWTEKGNGVGISASAETVLGTIELAVKAKDGGDLAFRPDRSTLRDSNGAPIDVEWRGGHVDAR